jgi:ATP-binding cassette subfamily C (CFTR/MRP) protein 1
VYSRKPIVLLDDIFSGLDPVTEDIIFQSLFGSNGILRRGSQTVVIATHAVHFLSSADMVILLGVNGEVVYQGSYSSFPLESIAMRDFDSRAEVALPDKVTMAERIDEINTTDFVPVFHPLATDVDTAAPDLTRQMGDSKIYMYYLRTMGLRHATLFVFLGAICMGFTPAQSNFPFSLAPAVFNRH